MTLRFLQGGGVMGALMREPGPALAALGPAVTWPSELRTLVGVMLGAPQPMFVAWGREQRMLYNDGYRDILGSLHPALGQPFGQVWAEILHEVGPIMARAFEGQPTFMDDIALMLTRHGQPEEAHFSFFYTPVRGETGEVLGVYCVCTETTLQVALARHQVAEVERLREMFEQSPGLVAVLRGPEHRFELANQTFRQAVRQRPLIGLPVRQALPELAGQGVFERLDHVLASGRPFKGEAIPLSLPMGPEGAPLTGYLDFVCQPLRDAAGQVTGLFIEGIDVTATQAQARVLRESEEKFRTFAQAVPNHVWTAPADGRLDWVNEQTLAYCGLPMAELTGEGWFQLVHPDDRDAVRRAWGQSLAQGAPYETEFRIRRFDGNYRWHLVRSLPIRDEQGRVERWLGTNTDIEPQRADREALRRLTVELEQRVEARTRERDRLWRHSPDLLAVVRCDGVLVEVNPAWTTLLGWAAGDVVGQAVIMLTHPEDRAAAADALARASVGVLPAFECRMRHADGSYRDLAWTAAPDGDAIFAFGRDISAARQQRAALQQAEEQLRQSQKMEAIGQLTGGIAHDFNNMLASIYGSVQLMQRRLKAGTHDGLTSLLDRAAASTQRASALTQRLLAFARRQSLDIRRVDVVALLQSLDDMLRRALGPRVALTLDLADALWPARIDASQLENAVLNLVINARDAMPEGGRLTIESCNHRVGADDAAGQADMSPGDYVLIRVIDTGVGMDDSTQARAFEPFFTTKPIGQGTGLGLSMVYGFVKQAGGQVRIHSLLGYGTVVSLYLPRDLSDDGALAAAALPAPAPARGETLLVVEDDPAVRAVLLAAVQDLGYRGIEAADAIAALAVIDTAVPIDLLVTDVGLPGLNGRQLAEIARSRRPGLRVLFVTGYAEQAVARQAGLGAGMQVISKPFVLDELAVRLRDALAMPLPAAGLSAQALDT